MISVEIDGYTIDLDPDQIPGFYFQLQDLIDLSALKGSRSTTIRLPASPQVRQALGGFSLAEDSEDGEVPMRVVAGNAVVFSGTAKVLSRSSAEYEVLVVGDNAAWKDAAEALQLRDIEMGETLPVTANFQESGWTDETTMVVFPVISYGRLLNRANSYNVDPGWIRPALRIWNVLQLGFAKLGYSISCKRGLDGVKLNYVMPCTTSKCFSRATDADDQLMRMFQTQDSNPREGITLVSNPADPIPDAVAFPQHTGNFYAAPGRWEPTADTYVAVSARMNFKFDLYTGPVNGQGGFVGFPMNWVIFDFTDNVVKSTVQRVYNGFVTTIFDDASIDFGTFLAEAGHSYGVGVYSPRYDEVWAETTPFNFQQGAMRIYDATESRWLSALLPYTKDKPLIVNTAAPEDVSLLDLLKWWTNIENIVVRTEELTKHITLEFYDDFCRPTSEGVNWEYKIDHTDPPRKLTEVLPKSYQFRYKEEDKDEIQDVLNKTRLVPYGGYDHTVTDGQSSPSSVDVGFAATAMGPILGGQLFVPCLHNKNIELDNQGNREDEFDWSPRILYYDGLEQGTWKFDNIIKSQYPRCYFVWPEAGRNNLSFGNEVVTGSQTAGTVVTRWRNRLRRSTAPALEGFLRLDDDELASFEFGRPVWLSDGANGVWCYVVEIKRHQFLGTGLTETKLVKV